MKRFRKNNETNVDAQIRQMVWNFGQTKALCKFISQLGSVMTQLFVDNSGVALKKYFDGTIKPENPRVPMRKKLSVQRHENVGDCSSPHHV